MIAVINEEIPRECCRSAMKEILMDFSAYGKAFVISRIEEYDGDYASWNGVILQPRSIDRII